jgi:hypothetical protein
MTREIAPGSDFELNQLAANRLDRNLIGVLNRDHRRPAARGKDDAIGLPLRIRRFHARASIRQSEDLIAPVPETSVAPYLSAGGRSGKGHRGHADEAVNRNEQGTTSAPRGVRFDASNSAGASHRDSIRSCFSAAARSSRRSTSAPENASSNVPLR